jgi:hypothetical protein
MPKNKIHFRDYRDSVLGFGAFTCCGLIIRTPFGAAVSGRPELVNCKTCRRTHVFKELVCTRTNKQETG